MTARIARLQTTAVRVPLRRPFVTALRRTDHAETLVVRVTDSDGVTGWGEAPQVWRVTGDSLAGSAACLEGQMKEAFLGAPADPWRLAPAIQSAVVGNQAAKSALDVALHDLAARRAGVPLRVHLAGGDEAHAGAECVATDITLSVGRPADVAEQALAGVAAGFRTVKLKVGTARDHDVAVVRAVRAAVGPGIAIRIDANQGWDVGTTLEALAQLSDIGLECVEQPVARRDLDGMWRIRRDVTVPVVADESIFDLDDLVAVLRMEAADGINIKLAKCGGLTPALELVRVAQAHGLHVMVGCMMESAIGIAAAAALAAVAVPDATHDLDAGWWAGESPYVGGPSYGGGCLHLTGAAGMGITAMA